MTPGFLTRPTPEEKAEWQAAYKEGYQAGKRHALRELKYAIKEIEKLEAFSTFTATTSVRE